jgi:hypothetical protein
MKHARNCSCWALGRQTKNGFHVRRIVWGYMLASHEVREGEQVRAATIFVENNYKPRRKVTP